MTQNVPGVAAGRRRPDARPVARPAGRTALRARWRAGDRPVIAAIFAFAVGLFQGTFTETVPVTVISQRAGLVMNPDAKVKMRGVQVGKVASIESLPERPSGHSLGDGSVAVALHSRPTCSSTSRHRRCSARSPSSWCHPPSPRRSGCTAARRCRASTSWSKSTRCSSNWCRCWRRSTRRSSTRHWVRWHKRSVGGAHKLGQSLSDLDSFLAKLEPSLPALSHDLAVLPAVSNAYADAAPDLVKTAANATRISQTIVDEQHNLDALLISAIGLADIGNDVLSANRQPLTNVLHLLVPTTDLTNEYHQALTCGFGGLVQMAHGAAVVGTEHQHIGESHVGRRTLSVSDEPAQGRGDGRPAVHGSAEAAVQHASAVN